MTFRMFQRLLLAATILGALFFAAGHARAAERHQRRHADHRQHRPRHAHRAVGARRWRADWPSSSMVENGLPVVAGDLVAEAQRFLGSGNFTGFPGPWCKAGLNIWLRAAGYYADRSLRAIDALHDGWRLRRPAIGAIAVMAIMLQSSQASRAAASGQFQPITVTASARGFTRAGASSLSFSRAEDNMENYNQRVIITDGNGNIVVPSSPTGQQTSANSAPVVIASDQSTVDTQDASDGPASPGTAATKSMLVGGVYNSTAPTLTNGQQVAAQFDAAGNLMVNVAVGGGTVEAGGGRRHHRGRRRHGAGYNDRQRAWSVPAAGTVVAVLKAIWTKLGSVVLGAGSAIIGKVGIDQTTPGTTNGVVVNSSVLPTGAATSANQATMNHRHRRDQHDAQRTGARWNRWDRHFGTGRRRGNPRLAVGYLFEAVRDAHGRIADRGFSAANQSTAITALGSILTALGSVVLGAGTNIIGKVGIDQTTPGTTNLVAAGIADGANITQGAIADAAATAGGTGSIGAKLRAISRDLVANIVLAAGANIIGKVGIDQTTAGVTNGANTNAALPAGSNIIGSVLGRTSAPSVTPAISTSAYSAGNVVGGLLAFTNAVDAAQSGLLENATLNILSVQTAAFTLYLFSANPSASTFNDKAAPNIAAADVPKLIDAISLATPLSGLGTHTLYAADSIGRAVVLAATTLYAVLITTGTPTFASASDVTVSLGIIED